MHNYHKPINVRQCIVIVKLWTRVYTNGNSRDQTNACTSMYNNNIEQTK